MLRNRRFDSGANSDTLDYMAGRFLKWLKKFVRALFEGLFPDNEQTSRNVSPLDRLD